MSLGALKRGGARGEMRAAMRAAVRAAKKKKKKSSVRKTYTWRCARRFARHQKQERLMGPRCAQPERLFAGVRAEMAEGHDFECNAREGGARGQKEN
jgi:hypothetical protein